MYYNMLQYYTKEHIDIKFLIFFITVIFNNYMVQ